LNPNTLQKCIFCTRLQKAAGMALHICPGMARGCDLKVGAN
jgi:hypothetical protein